MPIPHEGRCFAKAICSQLFSLPRYSASESWALWLRAERREAVGVEHWLGANSYPAHIEFLVFAIEHLVNVAT